MNVYDKAHETARALKECQQYRAYLEAREQFKANEKSWLMFKDFRARQTELQKAILSGQEPQPEKLEEINRLFEIISQAPKLGEFLKAEMELIKVVEDIQHILIQAIELELENI